MGVVALLNPLSLSTPTWTQRVSNFCGEVDDMISEIRWANTKDAVYGGREGPTMQQVRGKTPNATGFEPHPSGKLALTPCQRSATENVMATDQIIGLSPREYLAFERQSQRKHEYIDGEVREMVGASRPHILIAGNIHGLLWNALRGRPLEVYETDMRVRIPQGPYYYPDVTVAPSPPELEDEEADTLLNPLVIVEILSPSTRRIDRGEKLDNYRRIPSLTDYLIVAQDRLWIDRYVRDGSEWRLEDFSQADDVVPLAGIGCELRLADVYDRLFPPK